MKQEWEDWSHRILIEAISLVIERLKHRSEHGPYSQDDAWMLGYLEEALEFSKMIRSRKGDVLPALLEYQQGRGFSISRSRNFLSHQL